MPKGIFNNFFGNEDEDEIDSYPQEPTTPTVKKNPRKVLSMNDNRMPDSKINILEPRIFADAKNIANKLINGDAVLIRMENVDSTTIRRIVDFITGTIYAIEGDLQQIDEKVYLCTPQNYVVNGDVKSQIYDRSEKK
ncbi:cell division protein SepF [Fructilactobacillus cliffordii]|uniref:Cell division protein SepF n=1 Tax=Fructilactobacillus cliffordii TaxID=2940299 RepID=A0A9Q8ZU65_9LACO|nr:cell division protein SepF [Fructilactobacillus cliffordii]USS86395.1 cell division protein SepF [Fructilactobacillus cliffordii]USS89460.1 cell division protein SepF [Fructilactobacillus cliffordii]